MKNMNRNKTNAKFIFKKNQMLLKINKINKSFKNCLIIDKKKKNIINKKFIQLQLVVKPKPTLFHS